MDEVTATQAAALMGLSERTIRRRIATGEIRARHVAPNRYAIKICDLPQQQLAEDMLTRIQLLERRVRQLERRDRQTDPVETADTVEALISDEEPAPEAEAQVAVRALLTRLVQEVRRLEPLLAPAIYDITEAKPRSLRSVDAGA